MSDTINRQDAIDKAILIPIAKIVTEDKIIYRKVVFVDDIEKLPSAERKGKWIEDKYGNILCSECNWCAPKVMAGCLADRHLDYEKSDYCWHCGAHMEGEEE